jgi:hypothetical protein
MNDFFLLVNHGVGHQNKQGTIHHPNSLPPFLGLHDSVLPDTLLGLLARNASKKKCRFPKIGSILP